MTPEKEKSRREFVEGATKVMSDRLHCDVMIIMHDPMQGLTCMTNFINNVPMEFGMLDCARLAIAQRMQQQQQIIPTIQTDSNIKEGFEGFMDALTTDKKKAN